MSLSIKGQRKAFLVANHEKMTATEMASELNVNISVISKMMRDYGLPCLKHKVHSQSKAAHKAYVESNFRTKSIREMAADRGVTDSYIRKLFKEIQSESCTRKSLNASRTHSLRSADTAMQISDIKKDTLPKLDRNETPATGRMHQVDSKTYVFKTWAQLKEMGIEI